MNNSLQRWIDAIQEQPWFQQLRAKWDELDAQSKTYLQGAAATGAVVVFGWLIVGSWWRVHSIKRDLAEKDEILRIVQSADDEMRSLKDQIPPAALSSDSGSQPWSTYFESVAGNTGLEKTSLEVSSETAGPAHELSKEASFTLTLKKVNAKQLARFSFLLESGTRPVKIRSLSVDTQTDMSGYVDAKLTISAYTLKKTT